MYVSATPAEVRAPSRSGQVGRAQVIRPTGLLDPEVCVRPIAGQIDDLIQEIHTATARQERVLITTLTKKMAEDLTGLSANSGHPACAICTHGIDAMERMELIRDLRLGEV